MSKQRKLYLAYGSNLSQEQMAYRCPGSTVTGKAIIPDHELVFKGSSTGSYATIQPKKGSYVPVLVWEIGLKDELSLDMYEGYPTFYTKKYLTVKVSDMHGQDLGEKECMVYIMDPTRKYGTPSHQYYSLILLNYTRYGFNPEPLFTALEKSTHLYLKELRGHILDDEQ